MESSEKSTNDIIACCLRVSERLVASGKLNHAAKSAGILEKRCEQSAIAVLDTRA